ncbi:MAG: CPBP family intramembrane metalloprotease [Caldilineaceae bacterium]|nr:CPBP family intramembrane metalloprotease [Caldilineaceae bacterium]
MFKTLSCTTKVILFYLLALGLSISFSLLSVARDQSFWIGIPTMLTPTGAVLVMLLVITREGYTRAGWQQLGLQRFGVSLWPLAVIAPITLLVGAYTVTVLLGVAQWHWAGGSSIGQWVVKLFIHIVIMTIATLGEEIGWRGYLLPRLLPLGRVRAVLLSGLLHGMWHLPLILLTPFYHGVGNRWIVVPLFLFMLTAAGIFYGYLRLMSGSVWPGALAHSVFNTVLEALMGLTVPISVLGMEYLAGESGIISLLLLIAIVSVLLRRLAASDVSASLSEKPGETPVASMVLPN